MPEVVMIDPQHPYAVRFMDYYARVHGLKTVVVYTDTWKRRMEHYRYPELRSSLVAADYRADISDISGIASRLQASHDVKAVVPFQEPAVEPSVELAKALGLSWGRDSQAARFRNKGALKEHLREKHPDIRVNATRPVAGTADVIAFLADVGCSKVVLKPNGGFGNANIAMFDQTTTRPQIDAYFREATAQILAEEFISGEEYHIDGQTDNDGNVWVTDVFHELRTAANGRDNLQVGSRQVLTTEPEFGMLADYATKVVQAAGLRRSPFCLEAKIDNGRPSLIEVGARLVGMAGVFMVEQAHGPSADLIALAGHYYLSPDPAPVDPRDFANYDANPVRLINGLSYADERIHEVSGVDMVEQLPQFRRWFAKPEVGQRVTKTVDIFGSPYRLLLQGASNEELDEVSSQVTAGLTWNDRSEGIRRTWAKVDAARALANRRMRQLPRPSHRQTPQV